MKIKKINGINYVDFISDIKTRIQKSQIKAALSVNKELLTLYWHMGERIVFAQKIAKWGDSFLQKMSEDLLKSFPEMKGFSYTNLRYIKQWYLFWQQLAANKLICQQAVGKLTSIPWGHNLVILAKTASKEEALFYINKTIENNWSRSVLTHQIEGRLYKRTGKSITNFKAKLPKPQSDLASQIIKDPYNFDFLTIRDKHDEKELENALCGQLSKFLLELGAGFTFAGRQYKIEVDEKDYFIDLLFYHTRLHCYVVVELKSVDFKPEFAGKLNFYISAIDDKLKTKQDNNTIGILICKTKLKTTVEYALRNLKTPIGVSNYQITQNLPAEFKKTLPSIKDIAKELK
ncbi:MAG: PDDEXK nuclease domain-containing protein [Endomicrobia bacterium]|nr:PDDEXK nuclease domain-containing protein [Endomicrobiia bacterium]